MDIIVQKLANRIEKFWQKINFCLIKMQTSFNHNPIRANLNYSVEMIRSMFKVFQLISVHCIADITTYILKASQLNIFSCKHIYLDCCWSVAKHCIFIRLKLVLGNVLYSINNRTTAKDCLSWRLIFRYLAM